MASGFLPEKGYATTLHADEALSVNSKINAIPRAVEVGHQSSLLQKSLNRLIHLSACGHNRKKTILTIE
ncbi:unnamed protein product [Ilex paraguariensis]|uniref:Uncharacterized protein n=1 Tax=Ilex paraguariensis TaxID=185542 RepID=A0ABC8S4M8_9AQUA